MDIAAGFWIYEICRGEGVNEIVFSADGGSITISAKNISVGIPENCQNQINVKDESI